MLELYFIAQLIYLVIPHMKQGNIKSSPAIRSYIIRVSWQSLNKHVICPFLFSFQIISTKLNLCFKIFSIFAYTYILTPYCKLYRRILALPISATRRKSSFLDKHTPFEKWRSFTRTVFVFFFRSYLINLYETSQFQLLVITTKNQYNTFHLAD